MSQIKKIRNPFVSKKGEAYNCIGCAPDNEIGFQLEFFAHGQSLFAHWLPNRRFEGYMNVVHGGIQATLMDEIASWYVYAMLDTAGVTSRLDVQYHKPLYVSGGELKITADLKSKSPKLAQIETKILNANGVVCSSAVVDYYLFPPNVARAKYMYPGKEAFWD